MTFLDLTPEQQRATERYRPWRSLWYYARCKIAWDPAYPAFRERILAARSMPLLDVGCGIGLFSAYLRESGFAEQIVGVDPAADKIGIAKQVVPGVDFRTGSVEAAPEFSGHVVILDVLHYFDAAGRRAFLEDIVSRTAPGGTIWLRTTLRDRSWRYWATQAEEAFVRGSRWIVGGKWNFPTRAEIVRPFAEAGCSVVSQPMWGRTPFNSYAFEFTRPDAP